MHVGHDRLDIFRFFLGRIGVVHADVANPAKLVRDPELQTDRFRVTDMEITVRLRRNARDDFERIFPCADLPR